MTHVSPSTKTDQAWVLMNPKKAPGLDKVYGLEFKELYSKYEATQRAYADACSLHLSVRRHVNDVYDKEQLLTGQTVHEHNTHVLRQAILADAAKTFELDATNAWLEQPAYKMLPVIRAYIATTRTTLATLREASLNATTTTITTQVPAEP
jgi:hypothetical protein